VCRYRTCILIGNRVIRRGRASAKWQALKIKDKRFRGQKDLRAGTQEQGDARRGDAQRAARRG
jgi:hypothetical protein